jgi:hypothetical protein
MVKLDADTVLTVPDVPPEAGPDRALDPAAPYEGLRVFKAGWVRPVAAPIDAREFRQFLVGRLEL